MLKFALKIINSSGLNRVRLPAVFNFKKKLNMAEVKIKSEVQIKTEDASESKSDLSVESTPAKKIKLESDSDMEWSSSSKRTVATMCGAWRRDEVDGGLIFVFKTRDGGLSPDPVNESDFPENVEDFWEEKAITLEEIKVCI